MDTHLCHHWHSWTGEQMIRRQKEHVSMHVAWDHDTIPQNLRLVQFNHQLLETRLAKLDWVLSSRVEQMGLLIPRHWKFILSTRNSKGQKTGWEALHNFTMPFLFPQGVDETHIQHIFNETIHTKVVITTATAPKLDLPYSGMGFSYTFSSCVFQTMKQPSLLLSLPGQFIYAAMVSFARLEGRERKQGALSVLLPK